MSNSAILSDREICSGTICGVDFGPRIWVIARSPHAMLLWVYGHSYWSGRGQQSYARGHFTLLPDRSPRFEYHPEYKNFYIDGRVRSAALSADALAKIGGALALNIGQGKLLIKAIDQKRTLILEGGGGRLQPHFKSVTQLIEWKRAGHRSEFITYPEGVSEHAASRHKLGWKPRG